MTPEIVLVLVLVAAAAGYLLWQTARPWLGKRGCGGCGCAKTDQKQTDAQLITLHPARRTGK
jgi:hypothetical protein